MPERPRRVSIPIFGFITNGYGRDKEIGGVVVGINVVEIKELHEVISVKMDSEGFYCSEGDGINHFVPECLVLKNKEEEQK